MGKGRRKMGKGRRKMGEGRRKMGKGRRKMGKGRRKMGEGSLSILQLIILTHLTLVVKAPVEVFHITSKLCECSKCSLWSTATNT